MAAASSSQPSRWWRYRISLELAQVGAYLTHLAGEPPDRTGQARVFQVLEDLLPVADRPSIVQRAEQDRGDEVMLLAITRDRRDDLIQVQIPRAGPIRILFRGSPGRLRWLSR